MFSWESYLKTHIDIGILVDTELIEKFASSLAMAATQDKSVFIFGNGGSAATANHFSADLALMKIRTGTNCKSHSLNTDLPLSTAISNDINYESVISKQLEIFARPGDIAVGFSASGNSKNILSAFKQANEMGLETWAITGFDGGQAKTMSGINVIHFSSPRDYGLIENLHMCLSHFVVDKLIKTFK